MFVKIIPIIRLPRKLNFFDYLIPKKLENKIKINQIIEIPFRNQKIKGIIIEILSKTELFNKAKLKEINKLIEPEIILPICLIKLIYWIKEYYHTSLPLIVKGIIPEIPKREILKNIKQFYITNNEIIKNLTVPKSSLLKIKKAIDLINKQQTKYGLLYYQNWREKMIIYIKVIKQIISENSTKQILFIVPQITDIQKIYQSLNYYFPNQIAVLHNKLSKTFFWQEWQKIYNQKIKIVLGTRSTIFAPIKNLDLIIIDNEESLTEYKSEQNPHYNVQELAKKLSDLTGAKLIFSSQAPRIETFYHAQTNNINKTSVITCLNKNKSDIKVINMQDEWHNNNYLLISDNLQKAIEQNLEKKQKIFLFLNRRGAGTIIKCRDCGYLFKCPNCNLPLNSSYQQKTNLALNNKLTCHHCNFTQDIPTKCIHCNGINIKTSGIGIQRVEKEIKKLFPMTKILRIDKDTEHHTNYQLPITNYDIIIGTQFFFKQFNLLSDQLIFSLIGIISADSLLYRPDFRSSEKTFQQFSKIINWATNQSIINKQIEIIIQTHSPENYVIQAIAQQDYNFFYEHEIKMRERFNYPPFCKLIKLIYQNSDLKKIEKETNELINKLRAHFLSLKTIEIIGPISPIIPKVKEKYQKQILLKINSNYQLTVFDKKILNELDENWIIDIDPIEIL